MSLSGENTTLTLLQIKPTKKLILVRLIIYENTLFIYIFLINQFK